MGEATKGRGPVFGLDGGGTSTRLRFADAENRAIWEGRGEGINPNATGIELVGDRLAALFAQGLAATGLAAADFRAGCLGVAGADRPREHAELEAILRGRLGLGCPLVLTSDPDIALVGGLRRLDGFLLIAGTGSIAIARMADGTRIRAGGLGHFLGDEGSAFFIGFQAIRRTLRSIEERDLPTILLEPLMSHFALVDPSDFVALTYRRFDKAFIASASGIVEEARATGDPLALAIMEEARGELVGLVQSVRHRCGGRRVEPALVLWGGLFAHNAWLRDGVKADLALAYPELHTGEALESAAYGACMLALAL